MNIYTIEDLKPPLVVPSSMFIGVKWNNPPMEDCLLIDLSVTLSLGDFLGRQKPSQKIFKGVYWFQCMLYITPYYYIYRS
jgi:hypothetical protein